jgi:hypothetical protein
MSIAKSLVLEFNFGGDNEIGIGQSPRQDELDAVL